MLRMCLLLAVLTTASFIARAQSGGLCDRACLEAMIDEYADALLARDPDRLPLARTVKFTENGQRLALGDGLWNTVTGEGGYRLDIADVEAGQVAMMGTIREADTPTVFVLRLGVADRRIAEIETLVIRDRDTAERLDAIGAPRRVLLQAVPEAQRLSRDELVRIADMYFSGIERNDGTGSYPLADSCARLENGMVTAGDPAAIYGPDALPRDAPDESVAPGGPAGEEIQQARRMSCLEQFESGMFGYVTRIRDRRFVVVDTERSLAFAFAFFDNAAGDARNVTLADGRQVVSGPSIPWTWQIAEVFRIENGLIGPVESVLHPVPYGLGSGWSTWEDAMSSRPRW